MLLRLRLETAVSPNGPLALTGLRAYYLPMAEDNPLMRRMNVPRPVNNPLAAALWDQSYQAALNPFSSAPPNRHQSLVAQALAHHGKKAEYPGNLDINSRKVLMNPDGSFSTEDSLSFQDENGFEIVIPTVVNGVRMTPDEAIAHYYQTGQQLGVFRSPVDAERYANSLHLRQELKYSPIARALMGK